MDEKNWQDFAEVVKEIKQLQELKKVCEKWRDKYKPSGPESIIQSDSCYINCHELVTDAMDIIGYYEYED